ncbi:MAG: hypothetical protein Q8K69_04080, partial [Bacteroidota bacterium]|nr:hypothetical protein [Bacteroidota bacterium]
MRVHTLRSQVIQSANDALAFSALPGWIACFPVFYMRFVFVTAFLRIGFPFAENSFASVAVSLVEIDISQKIFRTVGSVFQEIFACFAEFQVAFPYIFNPAFGEETRCIIIGFCNLKCACCAVWSQGLPFTCLITDRNI